MKILLTYATNSGGCFLVGEKIQQQLSGIHDVVMKRAVDTKPEEWKEYDVIILGSPSWSVEGHEGYPQESMLKLIRSVNPNDFVNRRFAIFGCGDSGFTLFCGAVDFLSAFIQSKQGSVVIKPLKLDNYFFDLKRNNGRVDTWARELDTRLKEEITSTLVL